MKTTIFDIETTSLDAVGAGVLLCAVFQDYTTEKQTVFRIDEYKCRLGREAPVLTDIIAHMTDYDLVVGHNVQRFDLNFLMTRAFRLDVDMNSFNPMVYDTMKAFRRTGLLTVQNSFGKPSAGLDMVVDAMDGEQEKTKIYPAYHWQTIWGDEKERKKAMDSIVKHCQADVRMTSMIYPRLLKLDGKATIRRWR